MSTLFKLIKLGLLLALLFFIFYFLGNKSGLNSGFFSIFENIKSGIGGIVNIFKNGIPNIKTFY